MYLELQDRTFEFRGLLFWIIVGQGPGSVKEKKNLKKIK